MTDEIQANRVLAVDLDRLDEPGDPVLVEVSDAAAETLAIRAWLARREAARVALAARAARADEALRAAARRTTPVRDPKPPPRRVTAPPPGRRPTWPRRASARETGNGPSAA